MNERHRQLFANWPWPSTGRSAALETEIVTQYYHLPEYAHNQGLEYPFPYRANVTIEGDLPLEADRNFWVTVCALELIGNCWEKGASWIIVLSNPEKGQLVVRDDFLHPTTEAQRILDNINSSEPKSNKWPQPGGCGIRMVRDSLYQRSGNLTYKPDFWLFRQSQDQELCSITASANWDASK